jgi:DNA-binding transcriptional LysR family regulator
MLDIANLQAFVEVANSGSFSAAAEKLHLTQPAVSRRIASLEAGLEARVFDRIGRRATLTGAGRALLPRAKALLDDAEDIRRTLTNLSQGVAGTLSLGTSHHIGLHRLPPVLRRYHREYPQVRLDLRFMDSESACAEVERGSLELAVVTLPTAPSPRLELTPIWHDPLHFVVARDHPLAASAHLTLAALLACPAVLPERGTFTRGILERALAPEPQRIQVGLSTNYLETLKMLVSIGLGWSLLPGTLVSEELKALQVPGLRLSRQLGIVRHRNRTLSNAARAMLEACRSVADVKGERRTKG